jgi:hypothetical protein
MSDPREIFRLYADQLSVLSITGLGGGGFEPEAQEFQIRVERGAVFPLARGAAKSPAIEICALIEPLIVAAPVAADIPVVDRAGGARAVYRPLLVYCWVQAFGLVYETLPRAEFGRWEEALRTWCEAIEGRLGRENWPVGPLPAAHGDLYGEMLWTALALHHAGKLLIRDAWTDLAADAFGHLARRQQGSGAFLAAGVSDNPETHWYHELVILHAAASFAVATEDRALAAGVARATEYHLNETQPDHATNQPWGLFGFIWNEKTRGIAEGMIHAMSAHAALTEDATPQAVSGVSLMLVADVLYCLGLFLPESYERK